MTPIPEQFFLKLGNHTDTETGAFFKPYLQRILEHKDRSTGSNLFKCEPKSESLSIRVNSWRELVLFTVYENGRIEPIREKMRSEFAEFGKAYLDKMEKCFGPTSTWNKGRRKRSYIMLQDLQPYADEYFEMATAYAQAVADDLRHNSK